MATMQVELVSPERVLFSGEATMVILRTQGGGDIAFLPGHAPFLGALVEWTGAIHLADGTVKHAAIHGGFVEVSGDSVSILADVAELAEDIDVARAEESLRQAQRRADREHDADADAELRRAHARLSAAGGLGGGTVRRSDH
jgi:F-type H+-transporting ATPase subunit epsilon